VVVHGRKNLLIFNTEQKQNKGGEKKN